MYKCKFFFAVLLIFLTSFGVYTFAQSVEVDVGLARSSAGYRVTPGDVYTLTFWLRGELVTHTIVVNTNYSIRVANLGIVNGQGLTFAEVRNRVEAIVANNHPLSGPQLVITQPATFRVFVDGEVYTAGEHLAWGLTRLSSLVGDNLTRLASTRNITIRSPHNGQTQVFDLFQFWRFGDKSQNPYLRSGDVVTFNRVQRLVTIQGAVERPGTYQLLEGENIRSLIELYGNGLTPLADPSRVEVVRRLHGDDISGNRLFLAEYDLQNNFILQNYDVVIIPSIRDLRPVLFVEGAVEIDPLRVQLSGFRVNDDFVGTNQISVQFYMGETYASIVRRNRGWFSAVSDLENAYVVRLNGQVVPLNIHLALFDATYVGDVMIENHDRLIIPFRQFWVTVDGAVARPGRFPFIPDRGWEFYVAMAGGFVPGRNARDSIVMRDITGARVDPRTTPVGPETVITARSNHPMFVFNQYAPLISTILSVITTSLLIVNLTR